MIVDTDLVTSRRYSCSLCLSRPACNHLWLITSVVIMYLMVNRGWRFLIVSVRPFLRGRTFTMRYILRTLSRFDRFDQRSVNLTWWNYLLYRHRLECSSLCTDFEINDAVCLALILLSKLIERYLWRIIKNY